MQWTLTSPHRGAVLSVSGFLPGHDRDRLAGAVGWACAHSSGPLVLDLSALSQCPFNQLVGDIPSGATNRGKTANHS